MIEALPLSNDLKHRIWSVFPRPTCGSQAIFVHDTDGESKQVDPWGLIENISQLPSENVVTSVTETTQPKQKRVFRCV